ncbi:MAG: hypothetical protein ABH842_06060 [Candidatus Micrarchaeota archaeon]
MRIFYVLLLALFIFGCTEPPTDLNQSNTTNITNCTGPVCGVDDITYATDCDAEQANVSIAYKKECLVIETCMDSDGGQVIDMVGTISFGNETYMDYCISNSQLGEYVCDGGEISLMGVNCGEGNMCLGGICTTDPNYQNNTIYQACVGPTEVDLFSSSNVTFEGKTYSDNCVESTTVRKYFCNNDALDSTILNCASDYSCNLGRCEPKQYSCTDTDGTNLSSKGKVTVVYGSIISSENWDECENITTVVEYSCSVNNTMVSEKIDCGIGFKCNAATCVPSKCNDSDGGVNIYKVGTVVKEEESETDWCEGLQKIKEFTCVGDDIVSKTINCGVGYFCDVDHCVEGSVT